MQAQVRQLPVNLKFSFQGLARCHYPPQLGGDAAAQTPQTSQSIPNRKGGGVTEHEAWQARAMKPGSGQKLQLNATLDGASPFLGSHD